MLIGIINLNVSSLLMLYSVIKLGLIIKVVVFVIEVVRDSLMIIGEN